MNYVLDICDVDNMDKCVYHRQSKVLFKKIMLFISNSYVVHNKFYHILCIHVSYFVKPELHVYLTGLQ